MLMRPAGLRRVVPRATAGVRPVGVNVGLGAAIVVVAAMFAALLPAVHTGWRFAVVAFAIGVFGALTLDELALAGVAALGWLMVDGFLIDRFGELSWHGAPDLYRLMALVVVGAAGLTVGEAYRQLRRLRARPSSANIRPAAHIDDDEKVRRDASSSPCWRSPWQRPTNRWATTCTTW